MRKRQLYIVILDAPDTVYPVLLETAHTVSFLDQNQRQQTYFKEKLAYIGYDMERAQRVSTALVNLRQQKLTAMNNILSMYEQGVQEALKAA